MLSNSECPSEGSEVLQSAVLPWTRQLTIIIRVLSSGGGAGGKLPPQTSQLPPQTFKLPPLMLHAVYSVCIVPLL